MIRTLLSLLAAITLCATACKKTGVNKTTCTSTVNGYLYNYDTMQFNWGVVNTSLGTLSSSALRSRWTRKPCDDGAAYNTSDMCYYIFTHDRMLSGPFDTLVKVSAAGVITTYTKAAGDASAYQNIFYDPVHNKLYCMKDSLIAELTTTVSTYGATVVLSETLSKANTETVNTTTGDVYFATKTVSGNHEIRKYHPGSTASSLVATVAGAWSVMGLQFNKNDNMLYAMRNDSAPGFSGQFIRIDPAGGTVTTLAALAFYVNYFDYSVVLDPCTNRYIVSSLHGPDGSYINQLDMAGNLVQHNTPYAIAGLTVH